MPNGARQRSAGTLSNTDVSALGYVTVGNLLYSAGPGLIPPRLLLCPSVVSLTCWVALGVECFQCGSVVEFGPWQRAVVVPGIAGPSLALLSLFLWVSPLA